MSHVEGLSQITANLQKAMGREIGKMNARLNLAGSVLHSAVQAQASLTDHTQADLTKLGSPYSTKYDTDHGPHKDDSLVHRQTGLLYQNIEKVTDMGQVKSQVAVGVDKSKVPYMDELVHGSPLVRPRPFLQRAFRTQKPLLEEIMKGSVK